MAAHGSCEHPNVPSQREDDMIPSHISTNHKSTSTYLLYKRVEEWIEEAAVVGNSVLKVGRHLTATTLCTQGTTAARMTTPEAGGAGAGSVCAIDVHVRPHLCSSVESADNQPSNPCFEGVHTIECTTAATGEENEEGGGGGLISFFFGGDDTTDEECEEKEGEITDTKGICDGGAGELPQQTQPLPSSIRLLITPRHWSLDSHRNDREDWGGIRGSSAVSGSSRPAVEYYYVSFSPSPPHQHQQEGREGGGVGRKDSLLLPVHTSLTTGSNSPSLLTANSCPTLIAKGGFASVFLGRLSVYLPPAVAVGQPIASGGNEEPNINQAETQKVTEEVRNQEEEEGLNSLSFLLGDEKPLSVAVKVFDLSRVRANPEKEENEDCSYSCTRIPQQIARELVVMEHISSCFPHSLSSCLTSTMPSCSHRQHHASFDCSTVDTSALRFPLLLGFGVYPFPFAPLDENGATLLDRREGAGDCPQFSSDLQRVLLSRCEGEEKEKEKESETVKRGVPSVPPLAALVMPLYKNGSVADLLKYLQNYDHHQDDEETIICSSSLAATKGSSNTNRNLLSSQLSTSRQEKTRSFYQQMRSLGQQELSRVILKETLKSLAMLHSATTKRTALPPLLPSSPVFSSSASKGSNSNNKEEVDIDGVIHGDVKPANIMFVLEHDSLATLPPSALSLFSPCLHLCALVDYGSSALATTTRSHGGTTAVVSEEEEEEEEEGTCACTFTTCGAEGYSKKSFSHKRAVHWETFRTFNQQQEEGAKRNQSERRPLPDDDDGVRTDANDDDGRLVHSSAVVTTLCEGDLCGKAAIQYGASGDTVDPYPHGKGRHFKKGCNVGAADSHFNDGREGENEVEEKDVHEDMPSCVGYEGVGIGTVPYMAPEACRKWRLLRAAKTEAARKHEGANEEKLTDAKRDVLCAGVLECDQHATIPSSCSVSPCGIVAGVHHVDEFITTACDIWSLGIMAVELLTGGVLPWRPLELSFPIMILSQHGKESADRTSGIKSRKDIEVPEEEKEIKRPVHLANDNDSDDQTHSFGPVWREVLADHGIHKGSAAYDFVSCCLRPSPSDRPDAASLLSHPFIAKECLPAKC